MKPNPFSRDLPPIEWVPQVEKPEVIERTGETAWAEFEQALNAWNAFAKTQPMDIGGRS